MDEKIITTNALTKSTIKKAVFKNM